MTGGEKVLVVGALGLGALAFLKYRQTSAAASPPVNGPAKINSTYDDLGPGAGVLAPLYRLAKPLQPIVSAGVQTLNKAVGGVNPYGGLTRNADGTYTDGFGCKLTFKPDGTYDRDCGTWWQATKRGNVYKAGASVVNTAESAATSAYSTVKGWFS